jgi:hypothetical protein
LHGLHEGQQFLEVPEGHFAVLSWTDLLTFRIKIIL